MSITTKLYDWYVCPRPGKYDTYAASKMDTTTEIPEELE